MLFHRQTHLYSCMINPEIPKPEVTQLATLVSFWVTPNLFPRAICLRVGSGCFPWCIRVSLSVFRGISLPMRINFHPWMKTSPWIAPPKVCQTWRYLLRVSLNHSIDLHCLIFGSERVKKSVQSSSESSDDCESYIFELYPDKAKSPSVQLWLGRVGDCIPLPLQWENSGHTLYDHHLFIYSLFHYGLQASQ